jgi:hypothetical protein
MSRGNCRMILSIWPFRTCPFWSRSYDISTTKLVAVYYIHKKKITFTELYIAFVKKVVWVKGSFGSKKILKIFTQHWI